MFNFKKLITYLLLSIYTTSCSTMKESLVLGTSSGIAVGLGASSIIKNKNKDKTRLTSSLIGAGIGAISSYFIHKGVKAKEAKVRRNTLFNLEKFGVSSIPNFKGKLPKSITKPIVKEQWVDSKVDGQKLIEGHRVWIIEENSKWNIGQ